jgi:DNA-binding FrmR family transcriptional regulator
MDTPYGYDIEEVLQMARRCVTHQKRQAQHQEEFKADLVNRLSRIEGQVRGVQNMVLNDVYCDDVLTQISAVRSALSSVANQLFEAHLKSCVAHQMETGNPEVMDELLQTIKRMMKH